ncbi:hypothetical protein EMGBD2_12280 [Nitrospirota bacterium]|nr:hypothetical protein EMGBD2_12280 [Nitrospirota bacterium]
MVKSMNFKRVTTFTGPCRSTVMSRAKSQHWDADRRGACGDDGLLSTGTLINNDKTNGMITATEKFRF